jgi:RNA polymerase sigma-70 factor (ECF subfamily)
MSQRDLVLSDEDLMSGAAQGDLNAFEQLVTRHQASVWRFVCRFLRDAEEARDITQTAFLKLFEAASRYRRSASFKTYLFRIVTTTCIDYARKKRPYPMSVLPDVPDTTPSAHEGMIAREREIQIRQTLEVLPKRQRTALLLRYEAELSVREIAELLHASEKAVERLLAHARDSLHAALKKNLAT